MTDDDRGHRKFSCTMLVYWDETGRMQWQEKAERCGQGEEHPEDYVVRAAQVADTGLPFVPDGNLAWMVYAAGPDATTARDTALAVTKALGATLNPVSALLGGGRG
ncbi:hypothetical protein ACFPC0_11055 [Streptomyces andamanensis]|uniref:Uncharacterized protein n=1 Tax=Streptomyces andamanensis TaxID=1565035 RepID=A0ABV8TCL5_9ACTN